MQSETPCDTLYTGGNATQLVANPGYSRICLAPSSRNPKSASTSSVNTFLLVSNTRRPGPHRVLATNCAPALRDVTTPFQPLERQYVAIDTRRASTSSSPLRRTVNGLPDGSRECVGVLQGPARRLALNSAEFCDIRAHGVPAKVSATRRRARTGRPAACGLSVRMRNIKKKGSIRISQSHRGRSRKVV